MSIHRDLGIGQNHPVHNWEYADETARLAATGFVSGDIGKVALQLDDYSIWLLSATTPTWKDFKGADGSGVPAGGTTNQVLAKVDGTDGNVYWKNETAGTSYTNEEAQDAVGTILADTDTINFTYTDATPEIKADAKVQMSITSDSSGLKLSGDSASPGNNKVYGTDGSGVKGWKNDPAGSGGGREALSANRTYYVRTDGSDSNDGLTNSSGGAFLTIQKAFDTTINNLDRGIYTVTVQVANGTYTAGGTLNFSQGIGGPIVVTGDATTPTNVVINATSANCFHISGNGSITIQGFQLTTTTSGSCIRGSHGASVTVGNMQYGACANYHLYMDYTTKLFASANYTIAGAATSHWYAVYAAIINITGRTITITGTPAITTFLTADIGSQANVAANTFSGSATGVRYSVKFNSSIITGTSGSSTYLPGSSNGTSSQNGVYY